MKEKIERSFSPLMEVYLSFTFCRPYSRKPFHISSKSSAMNFKHFKLV